jgi:poly(rC)-binding protein 2/3/4
MDGASAAEHEMSEIPAGITSDEQANPASDVQEEPEMPSDEELKGQTNEESGDLTEEAQADVNDGNTEDQASLEEAANVVAEAEQLADVEMEEKKWPGWPGESVFRVLVPAQKVGAVIGRKGEFIKRMCEESRARIKILDGPPGVPERTVSCLPTCTMLSCYHHKNVCDVRSSCGLVGILSTCPKPSLTCSFLRVILFGL